jgi:hypothetical protein
MRWKCSDATTTLHRIPGWAGCPVALCYDSEEDSVPRYLAILETEVEYGSGLSDYKLCRHGDGTRLEEILIYSKRWG